MSEGKQQRGRSPSPSPRGTSPAPRARVAASPSSRRNKSDEHSSPRDPTKEQKVEAKREVYVVAEDVALISQLRRGAPTLSFVAVSPTEDIARAEKVLPTAEVVIGSPADLLAIMKFLTAVKWIQLTTPGSAGLIDGVRDSWAQRKADLMELIAKLEKELEQPRLDLQALQTELDKRMEKAKPQLEEARKAVENVKKEDLAIMKTLSKPPDMVRLCLEAVGLLLFGWANNPDREASWERARRMTAQTDFIRDVVRFDPMEVAVEIRKRLQKEFLDIKGFNYDSVYYAAKACGPLYIWLSRMNEYVEVLESFHPLPANIKALKASNDVLEQRLAKAKEDYAQLQESPFLVTRFSGDRCSRGVAEYCLAQVLMRERGLGPLYESSQKHEYQKTKPTFRFLSSLVVGVIGLGKVGQECCKLFRGLGMRVAGFSKTPRKELVDQWYDSLPELLAACDYAICCLPDTLSTRELLKCTDKALRGCLINVGEARTGGGCSIQDVLQPISSEDPLWAQRQFITPNVAGIVTETDVVELFRAQWERWTTNQRPLYPILWE